MHASHRHLTLLSEHAENECFCRTLCHSAISRVGCPCSLSRNHTQGIPLGMVHEDAGDEVRWDTLRKQVDDQNPRCDGQNPSLEVQIRPGRSMVSNTRVDSK